MNILGSGLEALKEFVRKCRNAGGIPIIRTRYRGERFKNNAVIVACYGEADKVKGGSITDIPSDVLDRLEQTKGDWKWLLGY